MKYIKLSFEYMKNKHYWKIMLMMIVPALLLSFLSTYSTTASFFTNFFQRTPDELTNFATVFGMFTELSNRTLVRLALFLLLSLVLAAVFAVAIGVIHKHMRTGRFMFRNIFKRINENFLQALSTILAIFLLVFLFGVFMAVNVYFWFAVTKHTVATFALSLIFMLVLFGILISFATLPFLLLYGSNGKRPFVCGKFFNQNHSQKVLEYCLRNYTSFNSSFRN